MDEFDYSIGIDKPGAPEQQGGGAGDLWGQLGTQLNAIAGGYLSRRVDIDLSRRYAQAGTVGLSGYQRPIYSSPQPGLNGATAGGLNLGLVLPLLAVAGLAVYLLKR